MKRVIELVIKELEDFRLGYMCDIALELYNHQEITESEFLGFRDIIHQHKPKDADHFTWWHITEYRKRIDFLEDLLTNI